MSKLLILNSDKSDFPSSLHINEDVFWLFLGRDYKRLLELKEKALSRFKYVDLGDMLYDLSYQARRQYIDYIASLSTKFDDLPWWMSTVAEKNTMSGPIYLYVCYLMIVKNLLANELKDKNICIFSESVALLETIRRSDFVKTRKVVKRYSYYLYFSGLLVRAVYRTLRFIIKSIRRKIAAIRSKKHEKKPIIETLPELSIIRTWVSGNNLNSNGDFKDFYFPGLLEYMEQKNINAVILPIVNDSKNCSYIDAMHWFRKARLNFIVPEDYYSLINYIMTIVVSIKSVIIMFKKFIFNGIDLSLLFQTESISCMLLWETDQVLMHYFLLKRLKEKGAKINKIIITYENMFPEKPIILAKAKYFPGVKVVGFQHASLYPLLLSSYTSEKEIDVLPMPDEIICSGGFFKDLLICEGYLPDRLLVGPALRFQYLLKLEHNYIREENDTILVPITLSESSALELLVKSWSAIKNIDKLLKIWIKPHPMMSRLELQNIIAKVNIPNGHYMIVEGNMADLLPKVSLMIATASATILDAIAYGIPVIRVRSDVNINLDPMDWFPKNELYFVARTPKEIEIELKRIFALKPKQIQCLKGNGKKLIEECFSPITEETLAAFIN